MTDEQTRLLAEVATRLHAIEQRLASSETAQDSALKQYSASDEVYRKELSAYREEGGNISRARSLATVLRVITIILLLYISYRVSA